MTNDAIAEQNEHSVRDAQTGSQSPEASLITIVRRLRSHVDIETKSVREDRTFDVKQSNLRKTRLLYEFSRAGRSIDMHMLDRECLAELSGLKQALAQNEAMLKAHVYAVREIADMMIGVMRDEEADGTYSTRRMAHESNA